MTGSRSKPPALLLLRHADAGDPGDWAGDDDLRPLSDKGIRQSERLGRHLARLRFEPDAIVSSPKLRARQTADIVARALEVDVRLDERLGSGVSVTSVEALLRDAGDPRRPILVGHDPDFSDLAAELTGASSIPVRKGALVRIDLPDGIRAGSGVLRWLLPPDLVPGEG
jgi:phosphohistidine phosphatase SixA